MGKSKRQKLLKPTKRKQPSKSPHSSNSKPHKKHHQLHHNRPTIPFSPTDSILLLGEGDLSFSRSLLEHHGCKNVTAAVYESSLEELREKYPGVEGNVQVVETSGVGRVRFGVDVTKAGIWREWRGKEKGNSGKGGGDGMDRIVFNFPHVGGKSKDVNRQVRYNQELLVSFFKNAHPTLSLRLGSSIIVTLFEGEPYTLWNIRDLARHSGLEVKESFKFQASAYPGYKHARTLGVVKGKNGEVDGERRGWRGEERPARSYVFVRRGEGPRVGEVGEKRKRGESDTESESETESERDEGDGLEEEDEERNNDEGCNGIEMSTDESDEVDND